MLSGIGLGGGDTAGVPLPDADRPVDVLDTDVAAVVETNVDPIANALVDDRRDADPARLGERLQARRDIDTIAVDIVAFNDDVAEVDAYSEDNGWLGCAVIRREAPERCTDSAQFTASTTLPNSTMVPSPISFTMRPLWAATAGSKTVSRCRFRAASVPASSAPIKREYPTTSAAKIAASLRWMCASVMNDCSGP